MDNKTIFIKTKKGEDEMRGSTTHLPGDIKRALLMVDGDLTFAEISKRAAPSLRSSLDKLFQELVKGGYIQDKSQPQSQPRSGNIPKMSVPVKIATPQKSKAGNNVGELDFRGGFPLEPSDVPVAGADKAAMLKAEAKQNIEREIEAAQYSAQHEAEAILFQAEQEKARQARDAARLKAEQEARARQENAEKARREAERLKEEQEALQIRIKLDAARQRAEQEAEQEAGRVDAIAQAQASKNAGAVREREEAQRIVRLAQEAKEREEQALKAARVREEAERAIKLEREAREREEQERQVREEAERIVRLEREAREREEQERRVREEAERIVRLEREAREREAQEAREREAQERRVREEAERIVRLEQEAREREAQERRVREEAERIVRLEQEAREREAQERRVREEAERIVRLEQETREREEQERKAVRVREEVQRLLKQEQQEHETESKALDQATPASGESSGEWGLFSFDTFQVDEPLYTSESHIDRNPANKKASPEQPAKPAAASPAGKSGTFAFDAFQVDEAPLPVEKNSTGQPAAAAKAAPPAPAGGRQPPAAGKAGKAKPDQERVRRAKQEQEQKAAEAQQAKRISEDQARVWAEAEQRALETARAEVDQAGKHAALTVADVPVAKPAPVARARRKQFSWGRLAGVVFKLGLVLLVLIAGALFVIPYVVSTREYLPRAEQLLSTKLHQPVHVGSLSGRILPTPRLELGEVYIGDAKQLQVKVAQINFSFTALFTDVKPVSSIEFQDIKVRGAWLTDASGWMQKLADEDNYPVSRMLISKGTLDADVFELTDIEGELNFDQNGRFTRADLRANGGKYDLGINAGPANKLDIALTVRNSALPLLPNWTFDTLTAKGELNNGELVVGNFDGQMFGGAVQGNADINWRSGWIAQGALSAKRINMQKLNKLLDGNVDGSARFKMASADLGKLAGSATLDGNFNSSDGTVSGLEIAGTARKLSRENLPGGRTHYDGLTGNFSFENGVYHFKQTKITASGLSAIATFDADTAKQQVSGKIGVTLSLPARAAPVELMLGGAIDSPTLVYAP